MGKGCGCGCLGLIVLFVLLGLIGSCANDDKGKQEATVKTAVEEQTNQGDITKAGNDAFADDSKSREIAKKKENEVTETSSVNTQNDKPFTVNGTTYVFISGGNNVDFYSTKIDVDWYAITSSKHKDEHGIVFKDEGYSVKVICVKKGTSPADRKNILKHPIELPEGYAFARFWLTNDEWECSLYRPLDREIIPWHKVKTDEKVFKEEGENGFRQQPATRYLDFGKVFRLTKDL
ncbi:MAG: hypothetical protein IJ849_07260 [Selenomonadaceae bacterium]|nr:hypothetical protein [Selenomonadaceae bacterium]